MNWFVRDGYKWYFFDECPKYFEVSDFNEIYQDMVTIKSLLNSKGYTIESLVENRSRLDTQFYEVLDILQNIEYNLDKVNSTEIKTPYYVEPTTIGEYAPDKVAITRWMQTLNDLFDILTGYAKPWGVLKCSDYYPAINNYLIILRGDAS